jgi:signal-transduction protein with cAMP-binding, CBS, and nucleotidyltransferase domain
MDHLRKLPILKGVSENKLYILSSLCKIESHRKDDRLIVEGEIGDKMYIILSGECTVLHTTAPPKVSATTSTTVLQAMTTSKYCKLFSIGCCTLQQGIAATTHEVVSKHSVRLQLHLLSHCCGKDIKYMCMGACKVFKVSFTIYMHCA